MRHEYLNLNENKIFYGHFVIISSSCIVLSYSFENLDLQIGQLVFVPLKQGGTDKIAVASFLEYCDKPNFVCRSIHSVFPHNIILKKSQIELIGRVSLYYLTPFEWCVRLLAPSFLWKMNKIKTFSKYFEKNLSDKNKLEQNITSKAIILNQKQKNVFNFILKNLHETILLHGVTGSGKTEIYLTIAKHIVQTGKNCLILVPEISLTPQMSGRFRSVFGEELSILHSGISEVSLMKEWISVYLGQARVVLGVRSAIFAPLENIGLIVVDEEHDQSYKSSEKPSYHARDVAVMRAKMIGACCLLGSATPSLESFFNAKIEKYKYCELAYKHAVETKVTSLIFETVQTKLGFGRRRADAHNSQIVPGILDLIRKNKTENFQTIVLLNRRGFVNYALCDSCRSPLSCPNCSVATTIHNFGKREICHYCDFNQEMRKTCPQCQNEHFLLKGIGTQNIESFLQHEIPTLNVERLDRDILTSHSRLSKILDRFGTGETDCLVGTQILAKGHDFAKATLIVILNVEDGLFLPDFRAAEKTFHLLTQAMGRVGRGKHAGIIALQSMIKSHPVIDYALRGEVKTFLERELKNRERAALPPYIRLILLEIKHKEKIIAEKSAFDIKNKCLNFWKEKNFNINEVFLSGPCDAPIEKINNIYRLQICIHTSKNLHPAQCIPENIYTSSKLKNILKIDVDPQNFM